MAAPSGSVLESCEQISVIDPRFCFPHPIELAIKRKTRSTIFLDVHGNIVFTEKGPFFGTRRVLHDAAGNSLLTIKPKTFTGHLRWRAFRGESTDPQHLLFSMRDSSYFSRSKSEVFFAGNTEEKNKDFTIKRSTFGSSCTIYKGQSEIVIAQVSKKKTSNNILKRRTRMVTIYPGVDSAFIVALIMILDQQDDAMSRSTASGASATASASAAAGAC